MAIWQFGLLALGLLISGLSVAFAFGRMVTLRRPGPAVDLTATLILPLSGPAETLPRLVAALECQTLRPRRLIVAVESERDPAFGQARRVAESVDLPIEVVVAGLAEVQGQKCRNQQAALDRIDGTDEIVVLLDGDIMPRSWWLATLVAPLAGDGFDICTGLRWQQVARHRLGAHLVCTIDRAAFLLPRFKARITRVVWGGSVALTRRAMVTMDLREALGRTISDDLSLVDAAKRAGLSIDTRSELLVPTAASLGVSAAWRFGVRQYRIIHIYRPWLWLLACGTIVARLAAWAVALAHVSHGGLLAWGAPALASLAILKQYLVGEIGRRVGLPDPVPVFLIQIGLGLVQPLVDLFHASVLLGAAWTRRIKWGHVTYRINGPYDLVVESRTAPEGAV